MPCAGQLTAWYTVAVSVRDFPHRAIGLIGQFPERSSTEVQSSRTSLSDHGWPAKLSVAIEGIPGGFSMQHSLYSVHDPQQAPWGPSNSSEDI